jgi:hypothetical protein
MNTESALFLGKNAEIDSVPESVCFEKLSALKKVP